MELNSTDAESVTSVFDLTIPQPAGRPARDRASSRENREARCTRKLARLLEVRHDLQGVYAPADQIAETLRWSA